MRKTMHSSQFVWSHVGQHDRCYDRECAVSELSCSENPSFREPCIFLKPVSKIPPSPLIQRKTKQNKSHFKMGLWHQ